METRPVPALHAGAERRRIARPIFDVLAQRRIPPECEKTAFVAHRYDFRSAVAVEIADRGCGRTENPMPFLDRLDQLAGLPIQDANQTKERVSVAATTALVIGR